MEALYLLRDQSKSNVTADKTWLKKSVYIELANTNTYKYKKVSSIVQNLILTALQHSRSQVDLYHLIRQTKFCCFLELAP